jgi:Tol biopolymer transport system component
VTPTGSASRLLARAGADGLTEPALSPDGKHIAYIVDGQALWQVNADGSHARQLYALPISSTWLMTGPRFAPDSDSITFTAGCCADFSIFSIAGNGTHMRKLFVSGGPRVFQDWSPDGKHFLYTLNGALWLGNARSGRATPLGGDATAAGSFRSARYSPDGTHIVAALTPAEGTEAATSEIVLMHTDGRYLTVLTGDLSDEAGSPSWSPDGKSIAFLVASGAFGALGRQHDLWIMHYNGTRKRNVTRGKLGDVVTAGWAR